MLEVVNTVTHNRHYWRNIKMSELSELYISMTLKTFAFSMIGVFVPIYLYDLGFSLVDISLYFVQFFIARIIFNYIAGNLTARYGPKHTISYAYVITLVYLGILLTIPVFNWSLSVVAIVAAASISLFYVAYHVDFSKIKRSKEEGAELSHMYLLVRVAGAIGPLLGGLIATLLGISVVIILAIVVMLLAIAPLMMTSEPTSTYQKIDFSKVDITKEGRNLLAFSGTIVGRQLNITVWPLYIALFIFSSNVYGYVGLVTSLSVLASILMAKFIGDVIDDNKGGPMLRYSAIANSIVHFFRIFADNLLSVIGINLLGEMSDTGVILPLTKGYYDQADNEADRIAYITLFEIVITIVRLIFWILIAILFIAFEAKTAFKIIFIIAGLSTLLVLFNNYPALKTKK